MSMLSPFSICSNRFHITFYSTPNCELSNTIFHPLYGPLIIHEHYLSTLHSGLFCRSISRVLFSYCVFIRSIQINKVIFSSARHQTAILGASFVRCHEDCRINYSISRIFFYQGLVPRPQNKQRSLSFHSYNIKHL